MNLLCSTPTPTHFAQDLPALVVPIPLDCDLFFYQKYMKDQSDQDI